MANLLIVGRVLLGLGFALDGGWWLYTWDVRAAYLDQIGAPSFVIVPIAATYLVCGVLVAVGRAVRPATLPLMAVAGLIATLLHTDLGPGGIGEYRLDDHARVNAQALLVQLTLVGALMLSFGAPNLRTPVDLRAVVLGRVLMGGYFVANALWQAAYYDSLEASGADPSAGPLVIAAQIVFGMLLVAGRATRVSVFVLLGVLVGSTILVYGDLSPAAAHPPNAQVHQWFAKSIILAGLLQLVALGEVAAARFRVPTGSAGPPSPVD